MYLLIFYAHINFEKFCADRNLENYTMKFWKNYTIEFWKSFEIFLKCFLQIKIIHLSMFSE